MKELTKQKLANTVLDFRLPRYGEIPNVGLYLEQAVKFIGQALSPLGDMTLTPSMISNYVKKGLVSSPVKKQYDRDQLAHLMFIALAKSVLSLDGLQEFIRLQERTYSTQKAYDYFCMEFENMLYVVFGLKDQPDTVGQDNTDEKNILRSCIIAVTYKIYLEKTIQAVAEEAREAE